MAQVQGAFGVFDQSREISGIGIDFDQPLQGFAQGQDVFGRRIGVPSGLAFACLGFVLFQVLQDLGDNFQELAGEFFALRQRLVTRGIPFGGSLRSEQFVKGKRAFIAIVPHNTFAGGADGCRQVLDFDFLEPGGIAEILPVILQGGDGLAKIRRGQIRADLEAGDVQRDQQIMKKPHVAMMGIHQLRPDHHARGGDLNGHEPPRSDGRDNLGT